MQFLNALLHLLAFFEREVGGEHRGLVGKAISEAGDRAAVAGPGFEDAGDGAGLFLDGFCQTQKVSG